jgi:tetratricopeptide (TPR) repeat protein
VATTLNDLAILYSNTQRFTESEKMYMEALEIRRRLAKDNPQAYEPDLAATLYDLGILYYNMNQETQGETLLRQVLEYYKRFAIDNPTEYQPKVENLENFLNKEKQ